MQKRIIFSVIIGTLVILISQGIASYISVNESIHQSMDNMLEVSRIISSHSDFKLRKCLARLSDISLSGKIDFKDGNWNPEKEALRSAYEYSIFTDGVFLLDKNGNVVLTYPARIGSNVNMLNIPFVSTVLSEKKPVISDIYTMEPTGRKVIFLIAPLNDNNGNFVGAAGGLIDPTRMDPVDYMLAPVSQSPFSKKAGVFIELVDSHGVVISSNVPSQVLTHAEHNSAFTDMIQKRKSDVISCYRCHLDEGSKERVVDVLAFSPLSVASWGISFRQPQELVFGASTNLKKRFVILGVIYIISALLLAIGLSRSIVKPINALIGATNRIASGDLSMSVGNHGKNEMLVLSKSFDDMREKLAHSCESLKNYSADLEKRVLERTKEVVDSKETIGQLLKKNISLQEEERKRVARELHDTIIQDISACLIKIDTLKLLDESFRAERIDDIRNIMTKTIDGIYEVIKDLRPTVLDDFGIEASILWMLNKHFHEKGIKYYLDIDFPIEKKMSKEDEITLFRILQEAIANTARHSNAKNVIVSVEGSDSGVGISIEDDGNGFNIQDLKKYPVEGGRGLGIIGMKERTALIGGDFDIYSDPGKGTKVYVKLPLKTEEWHV